MFQTTNQLGLSYRTCHFLLGSVFPVAELAFVSLVGPSCWGYVNSVPICGVCFRRDCTNIFTLTRTVCWSHPQFHLKWVVETILKIAGWWHCVNHIIILYDMFSICFYLSHQFSTGFHHLSMFFHRFPIAFHHLSPPMWWLIPDLPLRRQAAPTHPTPRDSSESHAPATPPSPADWWMATSGTGLLEVPNTYFRAVQGDMM